MTAPAPPCVLAIDTCGHACSLALVTQDHQILFSQTDWMARGHAAALPAMAATAWAQVSPRQVTALVVTRGPGGFTGMRVGLAYARAFALARSIPAFGIDVSSALALTLPAGTQVAIDSRRGDFFVDDQILDADALAALPRPMAGSWDLASGTPTAGWHEPCPAAMARHGWTCLANETSANVEDLEPLYIRAPSIG